MDKREFLTQLQGELTAEHVGLEDPPAVHLEDDLVAPLGVVGVHVALLEQIVLQGLEGGEESYTVGIVEGVMHGIAQSQVFGLLLIVFHLCIGVQEDCQRQG